MLLAGQVTHFYFPLKERIMRQGNIILRSVYRNALAFVALLLLTTQAQADDWPMWRHDAGRSSATSEQ